MATVTSDASLAGLQDALRERREMLIAHPVYKRLRSLTNLRAFLEHHVFAVWDFMSLLKSLQHRLTCVSSPWTPRGEPALRRLINEIVLAEESDQLEGFGCASHFELYLAAMRQCGAQVVAVEQFVADVGAGASVPVALRRAGAPAPAREFVETTFELIDSGEPHILAAAFTFGREDLIPNLFRAIVADLAEQFPGQLDVFRAYLERHIGLDEDEHAPLARQMVSLLCGDDPARWAAAEVAAHKALAARAALWDGIGWALDADPRGQV
jgi:Protein of unknown function (DUF3050)